MFFGTPDGTIMRVPVSVSGGTVRAGTPVPWLKAPGLFAHLSFVLDPLAQRALTPTADASEHQPLTAVVNWSSLLPSR